MTTTDAAPATIKPYHHGDLRRALLEAAESILEREGPSGLSLRAVAREAGVSPAAPYHHFKDKDELLLAVGGNGFNQLKRALAEAAMSTDDKAARLPAIGLAYIEFAEAHPATYEVMYSCARRVDTMPDHEDEEAGGFTLVKDAISEAAGGQMSEIDVNLAAIASWCAVHGLAEMRGFAEFEPLKAAMGGEREFLKGVLNHFFVTGPRHH